MSNSVLTLIQNGVSRYVPISSIIPANLTVNSLTANNISVSNLSVSNSMIIPTFSNIGVAPAPTSAGQIISAGNILYLSNGTAYNAVSNNNISTLNGTPNLVFTSNNVPVMIMANNGLYMQPSTVIEFPSNVGEKMIFNPVNPSTPYMNMAVRVEPNVLMFTTDSNTSNFSFVQSNSTGTGFTDVFDITSNGIVINGGNILTTYQQYDTTLIFGDGDFIANVVSNTYFTRVGRNVTMQITGFSGTFAAPDNSILSNRIPAQFIPVFQSDNDTPSAYACMANGDGNFYACTAIFLPDGNIAIQLDNGVTLANTVFISTFSMTYKIT